jgi:pimeloyl-ACP methyl ester carboxylesterase
VANFSTRASRLLAAEGIAALRFDFAGLGESEGSGIHVYETNRTGEMRAAAALLAERGFGEIATAGVCTGGFHAVRAVVEDSGISRAVAINAWLIWEPGRELDRAAHVESMRSVYLRAPVQARKWVRVAREAFHTLVLSRLAGLQRTFFPRPAAQAARAQFVRAAARNARIHIVAGAMDRSLETLEHFGARGRWLARQKGVSIAILPELDHALTTKKSQAEAVKALLSFIKANQAEADPVTVPSHASPVESGFPLKETPGAPVMPKA